MIFNDDSMLDFRGTGFGDSVMDSIFGYDAGEVVITGRVPGALYVDDFSDGEFGLQHIQPLEYIQNELGSVITVDIVDVADTSGILEETLLAEPPPAGQAANDDDAPVGLVALSHGKGEEPLILIAGDSHGDAGTGDLNLTAIDLHDLAIPPIPLPTFETPHITVTAPTFDDDTGPVFIGGRAYQSLSFLILDTPFVVGDSQLPSFLRPSLNELLGLPATDEDDGQAFVLPARSWLLH